ncbi:MAG: hypothetical protein IJY39_02205 [Clostridia bacterium]|nr:hypothetical protein [Clostridia bacterium]
MIDRSKEEYWTGNSAGDIHEYLCEYSEQEDIEVKAVECQICKGDVFTLKVDQDEGAIEVTCVKCKAKKLLLDSSEIWEECNPKTGSCPICKGKSYNIGVGFLRRSTGDVKHVFIGNRCIGCGALGSYVDWDINYGPTDEMEKIYSE